MKASKLPSGSWRCKVYSHTENGKKIYKSFTCADKTLRGKKLCEAEATAWAKNKDITYDLSYDMTFKEAADDFLRQRENVLSPTTIDGYKSLIRSSMGPLLDKKIGKITQKDIQAHINRHAEKHSPKTVKNVHGFISKVMQEYRPDFVLRTKLPQSEKPTYDLPANSDIEKLIAASKGTSLELPILLAAFGPMRRGEICALMSSDINGNVVHVHRNKVRKVVDGHNTWVIKMPKTKDGDRYIEYPDFVAAHFKNVDGFVCPLCPDTITKSFEILLAKEGIKPFRFHDLRHYSASIQHALGIPDQYIQARGGWGSDRTLKQVYRHVLEEKTSEESKKVNDYFTSLYGNK